MSADADGPDADGPDAGGPAAVELIETADPETRLRRIRLRSWRRGMRETDLLLGGFADSELPRLSPGELDTFESLLLENDQDLYLWISRKCGQPSRFDLIVERIAAFHGMR